MKKTFFTILSFVAVSIASYGQSGDDKVISQNEMEEINQKVDGLSEEIKKMSNLKISGYIQTQWQIAQSKGMVAPFAGGDFPANSDNRFSIRRGRLKIDYTYGIAKGVIQIDATEKGVKLKDAYVAIRTNSNVATLTAGVFDRPFGYEISYSSSNRETPERSRLFQTLFPDERDMGAKVTLQKITFMKNIRFDGGMFTGNGINPENDSRKDFIGHLAYTKSFDNISFGIGTSAYIGGVYQTQNEAYKFNDDTKSYYKIEGVKDTQAKRNYYGADAQFSVLTCAGLTQLRAEFVAGRQPGTASSSMSPKGEVTRPIYNRQFMGYYIYFIQDIPKTNLSAVVRFDSYDPNRKIKGNEIGMANTGTSAADIAYNTIGVGAVYQFNKALKVMAYYDMPKNEKTNNLVSDNPIANFSKDIKDNIFTLRLQCKF